MTDSSTAEDRQPPLTDSPWFWAMLFSAAALVLLVVISSRYNARQQRLEMQFQGNQEKYRRQLAGESSARETGAEGDAIPPAAGDLIIPIWPVLAALAVVMLVANVMLRRGRMPGGRATKSQPTGEPP